MQCGIGIIQVSGGSEWTWIFDTLHRETLRIVSHQGALLLFQQATSRTFLTTLSFEPSAACCCILREVPGNLCYCRWSKRVQNMGSVYSFDCFICGSTCLLLSESCVAVSLLKHVGILDNRTQFSFWDRLYIYFAWAAPETQLLKSNWASGCFLNYSIGRIYAIYIFMWGKVILTCSVALKWKNFWATLSSLMFGPGWKAYDVHLNKYLKLL